MTEIRFGNIATHKKPAAPLGATAGTLLISDEFRTIRGSDRCCYHQCYI
jgi:hypothetical protein